MPRRRKVHLLIIDQSTLARNMYAFLFTPPGHFLLNYADSLEKLKKLRTHERPDLLIINCNSVPRGTTLTRSRFPTILLYGPDRIDLKEAHGDEKNLILVEKPFYPYDLLSMIHHLNRKPARKSVATRKKQGGRRG